MDKVCAKCGDLEIFSTRFYVLLGDYYCRLLGLGPSSLPVTRRAEEARVRRKAASNAREGTGSEGDRRLPDDGSSTSGTTSTPSGARRSILRWHASPEAGAAGGKRGSTRVGQPGRDGWIVRRRKASAVRRSGRQQGGSGWVARHGREARSQDRAVSGRGGRLGEGSWFSRVGECRPQGWNSHRCKGLWTLSRRSQAVAKEARTAATGGQKPPEASGSCPARAR